MMVRFKINSQLLPLKLHYLFFFGGTAPFLPFLPVYARQLGISEVGIGLIYAILPITGLLAKPLVGALADRLHQKKTVFLVAIISTAITFFAVSLVPAVAKKDMVELDCGRGSSFLKPCDVRDKCALHKVLEEEPPNATTRCHMSCLIHKPREFRSCFVNNMPVQPSFCPNIIVKSSQLIIDSNDKTSPLSKDTSEVKRVNENVTSSGPVSFTFDTIIPIFHALQDHSCVYIPVNNITFEGQNLTMQCMRQQTLDCVVSCDNVEVEHLLHSPSVLSDDVYTTLSFWLLLVLLMVNWTAMGVVTTVGDVICFEIIGPQRDLYGAQRVWGTVGFGIFSLIAAALISQNSVGKVYADYTPAIFLMLGLLLIDTIIAFKLRITEGKRSPSILKDMGRLLTKPQVLFFLLWSFLVGMCTALIWYSLFMYVEDLWAADCYAESNVKLLEGLIIAVQCFAGEVPFFFLAGWFIRRLGHSIVMGIVLLVFGIRFILYAFITDPWYILPVEVLQGLTYGVMYATMTSYAAAIAPPGTETTVQGIAGATFEGLGVSMGSFVGGILYHLVGGADMFLLFGLASLLCAFLHFLVHWCISKREPAYQLANQVPEEGLVNGDTDPVLAASTLASPVSIEDNMQIGVLLQEKTGS